MVDESTGKAVANFLDEDHDTVFVGEENPSASDTEIMEKAREEKRIIVTNDKDFGQLAVQEDQEAQGILLLRLKIETPENKIRTLENILEEHEDKLEGHLTIAKEDQIKTRKI